MVKGFAQRALAAGAASMLVLGGGAAALGAGGHSSARSDRSQDAGLVKQCIAAKRAGSASATGLCAAANAATSPASSAADALATMRIS
jgi:hypothetical protein